MYANCIADVIDMIFSQTNINLRNGYLSLLDADFCSRAFGGEKKRSYGIFHSQVFYWWTGFL